MNRGDILRAVAAMMDDPAHSHLTGASVIDRAFETEITVTGHHNGVSMETRCTLSMFEVLHHPAGTLPLAVDNLLRASSRLLWVRLGSPTPRT